MFKQVCLLTRRPGMTMEAFEDYYEQSHAPLLSSMMPQARRYVRRFVQPERNPNAAAAPRIPFDCLMELWWDSRAEFEACMASLGAGDTFNRIYEDEEKIFASHDNPVFTVEEADSPMRGWQAGPEFGGGGVPCNGRNGVGSGPSAFGREMVKADIRRTVAMRSLDPICGLDRRQTKGRPLQRSGKYQHSRFKCRARSRIG